MKAKFFRIAVLGLILMLFTGAAAQTADDVSYTTAEKLLKQLNFGSGFKGTLTITADAVEGRESEAYSTIMPLVFDLTYIMMTDTAESRLTLATDASEYQQGSAEFSLQNNAVYMRSSLLEDGWYMLSNSILEPLLQNIGVDSTLPAAPQLQQAGGLMPGTLTFFSNMAFYLFNTDTANMNAAMQAYQAKIDFWLESYRENVQMIDLDDGGSAMEVTYRVPPEAVKDELKQLIIDLMADETLLNSLTAVMPADEAAIYLDPELQPYYFYAVDELPLQDDLTIRNVLSLLGSTVEQSVVMPMYDSVSGAATLAYTQKQAAEDTPLEYIISLTSATGHLEIDYSSHETTNGTVLYQGTILSRSTGEDGTQQPALWAAFELSRLTQTTKDLQGYETQYETIRLSVAPAESADGEDAAQYTAFSKTDIALDMIFKSLSAKTSPTSADITLAISGDDLAQTMILALTGATAAQWTPEAFDPEQATDLSAMPADELQSLLSQVVIKGGLLFLPYLNLPQSVPAGTN